MTKEFLLWFTGFCEAEGNFQVFKKTRKTKSSTYFGVGVGFHLRLALRDYSLLKEIKETLNWSIYKYTEKKK
jgi:hypothetical protein